MAHRPLQLLANQPACRLNLRPILARYASAEAGLRLAMAPSACFEYAAGPCLFLGYRARSVAVLLAGWCLLTALIFHRQFYDLDQLMNFFKNLTMAGGFLWLAKTDPGGARVGAPSAAAAHGR